MSVLVIDKAQGPTSFAVTREVQRVLALLWGRTTRSLKIGHGGTLDPMASGVLPICVGEATKLAPFLLDADKAYEATVTFGVETDTLDAEGTVVARQPVEGLTTSGVEEALAGFRGSIEQVPPMYSALKRQGKPLYEYARAGEEVAREPRRVTIHELTLLAFEAPDRARLFVRCSKGTYVRTLAADLGRALGPGAHLTALRRVASGPFSLAQAISVADLRGLAEGGGALPFVSLSDALQHLAVVAVDGATAVAIEQGKQVPWSALGVAPPADRVRLTRSDGSLLAVAEPGGEAVRTLRVFRQEVLGTSAGPDQVLFGTMSR